MALTCCTSQSFAFPRLVSLSFACISLDLRAIAFAIAVAFHVGVAVAGSISRAVVEPQKLYKSKRDQDDLA